MKVDIGHCLGFIFLSSMMICCKEDASSPQKSLNQNEWHGKLLAKIHYGDNWYDSIFYNPDSSIHRIKRNSSLIVGNSINYQLMYQSNKKIKSVTFENGKMEYEYSGDSLITIYSFGISNAPISKKRIAIVNQKIIEAKEEVSDLINNAWHLGLKTTYQYNDSGNLKMAITYSFNPITSNYEVLSKDEYTNYDAHSNPNSRLDFFPFVPHLKLNLNNPIEQFLTNYSFGSARQSHICYIYIYDADGWPIQQTTKTANETGQEVNFEKRFYYY